MLLLLTSVALAKEQGNNKIISLFRKLIRIKIVHGTGVPPQRCPEGEPIIPCEANNAPVAPDPGNHMDRRNICGSP